MRILIVIPHFYQQGDAAAPHGSRGADPARRRAIVERCLGALHETFGPEQRLCSDVGGVAWPYANTALAATLDVVLCFAGAQHLADALPPHLFIRCHAGVAPPALGFVCHQVLREKMGGYDYYGYLEDDIELTDPLFFAKLAWFNAEFGDGALLQPNRFEAHPGLHPHKLYIDGTLRDRAVQAAYQDITVAPRLSADTLGRSWLFQRTDNVHAGCFFLNPAQMRRAVASPEFGQPTGDFFGPLESSANIMIMRNFAVYKPGKENAGFLEARHLDPRHLVAPP